MGINVVGDDFIAGTVDYTMCDFWDRLDNASSIGGNGSSGGSGSSTSGGLRLQAGSLAWVVLLLVVVHLSG